MRPRAPSPETAAEAAGRPHQRAKQGHRRSSADAQRTPRNETEEPSELRGAGTSRNLRRSSSLAPFLAQASAALPSLYSCGDQIGDGEDAAAPRLRTKADRRRVTLTQALNFKAGIVHAMRLGQELNTFVTIAWWRFPASPTTSRTFRP